MANIQGFFPKFMLSAIVATLLTYFSVSYYGVGNDQVAKLKSLMLPAKLTTCVDGITNESGNVSLPRRHAVVCMIFTTPDNWLSKGRAVRLTWAKRCPFPIFFYSGMYTSEWHEIQQANNSVALDVPEGRGWLADKTLAGLRYSLDKFGDVAEWFMKADDDTYVIWENLEFLLDGYQRQGLSPSYLGRKFDNFLPNGYASGGAGYLISKQAAELILHKGPTKKRCPKSRGVEDLYIGRCLAEFGIYPVDTRDKLGKLRFHSDNPLRVLDNEIALTPYYHVKFNDVVFGNPNSKDEMLSDLSVTFHYVTPGQMMMFDYLLYHIRRGPRSPIGVSAIRPLLSPLSFSTTISSPATLTVSEVNRTTTNHTLP